MGAPPTIEIVIDAKGDSVLQTKGFNGSACRAGSKFLENALGIVEADAPTPEMYQPTFQREEGLKQHGG